MRIKRILARIMLFAVIMVFGTANAFAAEGKHEVELNNIISSIAMQSVAMEEIMKRKVFYIVMVSLMLLVNIVPVASAVDMEHNKQQLTKKEVEMISSINVNEEIYRAENGITDVKITEEMKKQMAVSAINS